MEQQGMSATEQPAHEILSQLAALTALVQAQGEEIARLKATATMPARRRAARSQSAPSKLGLRGWLHTVAGATAAAALLTMAKEASTAEAAARGTILPGDRLHHEHRSGRHTGTGVWPTGPIAHF